MNEKLSTRRAPPEDEKDWEFIWSGAQKAHDGWFVVSVLTAIFGNWKAILIGATVGLALGGQELLRALGVL